MKASLAWANPTNPLDFDRIRVALEFDLPAGVCHCRHKRQRVRVPGQPAMPARRGLHRLFQD
ncbi:MAG: hypothetical protein KIS77_19885 [Saprospiraceae bacterium]|nr:hypothetical protein [Saprospiraceae bacterium]